MDTAKALLIGLDGHEHVVTVPEPPPPVCRVPVPRPWALNFDQTQDISVLQFKHREFHLSTSRTRSHQWMRVYNGGRTQTPEDGYVYFERRTA